MTVVRESTGGQVYHNAWITGHELTAETVKEVAVLHLTWPTYQAIRQALGARRNLLNDLRALTR